jgi:tRNA-dihydrouridine synthase A
VRALVAGNGATNAESPKRTPKPGFPKSASARGGRKKKTPRSRFAVGSSDDGTAGATMRVASVRASAGRAAVSAGRREFHVAPMRDYTDRHHRRFTRLLSREAKLWSEMEKPHAILKAADASGNKLDRLLSRGSDEGYEVFQIGGNDPVTVAQATRLVLPYGYDELNLNCGCPAIESGGGDYGAALMRDGGDDAAFVIESMVREVENADSFAMYGSKGTKPKVSVKCRVGIAETLGDVVPKDASAEEVLEKIAAPLERFIKKCADAGAASVVVHCRQAVMSGMSPSKNRGVPPLRPEILFDLVARGDMHVNVNDFCDRPSIVDATQSLDFVLNGGVSSFADVAEAFAKCPNLKGAQAGRWPLLRPFDMLHVDAFLLSLDEKLKVSFLKDDALDGVPFEGKKTRRRLSHSPFVFDRDASARAVAAAEAYAFPRAAAYEHQSRRNGNEKGAAARPLALALADLDDRLERSTGNDESVSEASSFSSFETDDDDDPDALANAVDGLLSVCGELLEVEGGTNRAKRTRKALAKAVGKKVGGKQRGTRAEAAAAAEAGRVAS